MPNPMVRGIRTFLWAFLGSIMTSGLLSSVSENGVVDWAVAKKVLISALAAGLAGLISWAYNALEDRGAAPVLISK